MSKDQHNVRGLVRAIAYDARGSRLGRVAQVFLDDRTDEPAWVAVDVTRTRGMRLLPLAGAARKGRHLVIRAERATVRSAPRIDLGDGQLSSQDESRLLEHYGLAPVGGADELSMIGEGRPAPPWADDAERETTWDGPAQQNSGRQDNTQSISTGWDQPTRNQPTRDQPTRDQSAWAQPAWTQPGWAQPAVVSKEVGDRDMPSWGQHSVAPSPQSQAQLGDTAPSPTIETPTASPADAASATRPDAESSGSRR